MVFELSAAYVRVALKADILYFYVFALVDVKYHNPQTRFIVAADFGVCLGEGVSLFAVKFDNFIGILEMRLSSKTPPASLVICSITREFE